MLQSMPPVRNIASISADFSAPAPTNETTTTPATAAKAASKTSNQDATPAASAIKTQKQSDALAAKELVMTCVDDFHVTHNFRETKTSQLENLKPLFNTTPTA